MFENVLVQGVHVTRYIMSYIRMGGDLSKQTWEFEDWLESLGLSEAEVDTIVRIANNGRLELELSAAKFLAEKKTKNK